MPYLEEFNLGESVENKGKFGAQTRRASEQAHVFHNVAQIPLFFSRLLRERHSGVQSSVSMHIFRVFF